MSRASRKASEHRAHYLCRIAEPRMQMRRYSVLYLRKVKRLFTAVGTQARPKRRVDTRTTAAELFDMTVGQAAGEYDTSNVACAHVRPCTRIYQRVTRTESLQLVCLKYS